MGSVFAILIYLAAILPSRVTHNITQRGATISSSHTYDNNGNTTVSSGTVDSYDFENLLVNRNNAAVQIVYDGDGNRVKKMTPAATTFYVIDDRNPTGYAQVLEELTTPGLAPTVTYTYGHS